MKIVRGGEVRVGTREECEFPDCKGRVKQSRRDSQKAYYCKLSTLQTKRSTSKLPYSKKGSGIKRISDFSTVILEAKRQWCSISKILKKKYTKLNIYANLNYL